MARLFTCGLEENDLLATAWTSIQTLAPTIVTSGPTPHSGTYCMVTPSAVGACSVQRNLAANKTTGTLFSRFYFQISSVTPSANTAIMYIVNSGATVAQSLLVLTTGAFRMSNAVVVNNQDSATGLLVANTWYRVEFDLTLSTTVGSMACRVYLGDATGTPLISLSLASANTLATNVQGVRFGKASVGGSVAVAFDDIAINDETGASQNGTPGPEKIALMAPNSDVSLTWTKAGSTPASTGWDGVNDVPGTPDDAVTYNENSGTSTDRFGLTALPAEVPANASFILADVSARVSAGTTAQQMLLNLWDDLGTNTQGVNMTLPSGTWAFTDTIQHLVVTTGGKTLTQLNAFNAGYAGTVGAGAKRVSALWVNVAWLDGPPPPPLPLLVNAAPMRAASW